MSNYDDSFSEKPFWSKPPWVVLFDLIKLKNARPWDIRISYLLNTLLEEMKKMGFVDFTASGVALLSSSTIFRMKTEMILELERPPPSPNVRWEQVPPPIQMPYRFEYTFTTLDDLLDALEEAIRSEKPVETTSRIQTPHAPPIIEDVDDFMLNINDHMEDMFNRIVFLLKDTTHVSFSKLISGLDRLEIVRALILILFLACKNRIIISQEEEFGEILMTTINNGDAHIGTGEGSTTRNG